MSRDVMVIAGASFQCGVRDLGEVARRHGARPLFLERPHNAILDDGDLSPLRFESGIAADIAQNNGWLLPLLESWVSEGCKLAADARLAFDRQAASTSHSKLRLSATLAAAGLPHVRRQPVESCDRALRAANEYGYPVVLRPDTGYSGRGVWIADSPDALQTYWRLHLEEKETADYGEMRSFMGAHGDAVLIEPCLGGDEWSLDCAIGPAGTHLIRVCRKVTATVAGKPITLGYWLSDSADLWDELRQAVAQWRRVLFQADVVTFACFDIRRDSNGRLVPLDFGVRLGGDRIPLLVRRAALSGNPYAGALDYALTGDPSRMIPPQEGHSLIHAFADRPGIFDHITISRPGDVIDSKPRGSEIQGRERAPFLRRVGSILAHFGCFEDFQSACRSATDWIQIYYG